MWITDVHLPPPRYKTIYLLMMVNTSSHDKLGFTDVDILLGICNVRNLVKQELYCSNVKNVKK